MTVVPLPDIPCLRVRLIYTDNDGNEMGNRFYLSYSGSAPTAANCTTLATDIAGSWNTDLSGLVIDTVALTEVDVLDIATNSGLSGQWTGTHQGTNGTSPMSIQCAINVEFGIARRYRGGKPRMFLPTANGSELTGNNRWASGFVSSVSGQVATFFSDVTALSVGAVGTLKHVNLSYYSGFKNITNSSGRERAVPTYRATAQHDDVTGYFCKATIGSQKRRRTSTTP